MDGNRALCAFLLCKSCFIRDIDLCGVVWQLPAAFQTRICAHGRDYEGMHRQQGGHRSISRIKHVLHRRNAQSARFPAKPVCGSRAQRLPGRANVPMIGRAGQTRLGTRRLSVGGGRCPGIWGVASCAHDATGKRRICTRIFALAASSYHYLTGYCFWSHAGHAFVSNAPVPSAWPDGEL